MTASPLEVLDRASSRLGVDLWVKRDDLLPLAGGGNKVRKLLRIVESARAEGANALVTTGAAQSNHARVTALLAARLGWPCHLVLHGDADLERPTGNLLMMRLAGAHIRMCPADEIRERLATAMQRLRSDGHVPALVPGGGHCLEGALAYAEAIRELREQSSGWVPDWLVHASGTGATQAGLVAGCVHEGWSTRVVGVSVARTLPRGAEVVRDSFTQACSSLRIAAPLDSIDFRDDWIEGGYGFDSERLWSVIAESGRESGLMLDPTYTGKAFLGLLSMIRTGEIPRGSRVLFWHTGGLPNLLAGSLPPWLTARTDAQEG